MKKLIPVEISIEDFCDELDYKKAMETIIKIDEKCMASWDFTIDMFKHFLALMIIYYEGEELQLYDCSDMIKAFKTIQKEIENVN